jgi:hypothetical protein
LGVASGRELLCPKRLVALGTRHVPLSARFLAYQPVTATSASRSA